MKASPRVFRNRRRPFPEHEPAKRKGEKAFRVNERPVLRGARDDGRMTLSQQSARLGLVSVQLELSLRLRLVLKDDPEKARDFARAVVAAWEETRRNVETRRNE